MAYMFGESLDIMAYMFGESLEMYFLIRSGPSGQTAAYMQHYPYAPHWSDFDG